ncbi:L,D-transpeptidase family protein [Zavarzinia sp. CC-PAN008]|uniref:L,D-transpeptidase family protein n=1 Tax=Zavarzinia sp. CC-PAN008 TaxID=3243332 RepID=UPI003F74297B
MDLRVAGQELACAAGRFRCAIGRGGFVVDKREGDGGTPVGTFALRRLCYRADRLAMPSTRLEVRAIRPDDGWCDDPASPAYNRPVRLPFAASHEEMWRDDHVYDLVVVLGHNDDPPVPGAGSAIFMHLARADYAPTAGCVALALPDLLQVLAVCGPEATITLGP